MGKRIRWIIIILLIAIFLFCAGSLVSVLNQYKTVEQVYIDSARQYTTVEDDGSDEADMEEEAEPEEETVTESAPISVDFESLQEVNSDVAGWIYCEDTVINYPILEGEDNDFYLHHTYEGEYSSAGSIFIEAANRPGFVDSNTVIYGHHMKDGSMFASLDKWADQEYYEEHPVMWLLTPEQDYKVVLFSGYTTSAYSDTYLVFTGPCDEFDEYLANRVEKSDFQTDVELDLDGYYVLLSTCAYSFEDARYVLHGMLVPVDRQRVD
ncbi:MAG: class B sortase [Lachnospiraceae bacterium]|nr:class B sortase [Lachnospiraceae bacterium]